MNLFAKIIRIPSIFPCEGTRQTNHELSHFGPSSNRQNLTFPWRGTTVYCTLHIGRLISIIHVNVYLESLYQSQKSISLMVELRKWIEEEARATAIFLTCWFHAWIRKNLNEVCISLNNVHVRRNRMWMILFERIATELKSVSTQCQS